MALRALTPGKAAYCSDCGASALPDVSACDHCGAKFEGFMDALLCPICNAVNAADARECKKCSAKFPEAQPVAVTPREREGGTEEEYLRNILRLSREKAKARGTSVPPADEERPMEPISGTEIETEEGGAESSLWKLSQPFDRMLERRKQRLAQMDGLIERARQRITTLAESANPLEAREREELKRQIEELLLEKEDILKLEEGLVDMENTYRNILRMQQDELKSRESSLRARIDAFRHELENRERTYGQVRERESDIVRREDEFRRLTNRIHERERELDKREDLLREKARLLDERHHALSEGEVDLERRRWAMEQRTPGAEPPARLESATITLGPSSQDFSDLKTRMSEMEEQMERLQEERNRLVLEHKTLKDLQSEIRTVMADLDELLGELPDDKIKSFARSDRFARYEKVLDSLGE